MVEFALVLPLFLLLLFGMIQFGFVLNARQTVAHAAQVAANAYAQTLSRSFADREADAAAAQLRPQLHPPAGRIAYTLVRGSAETAVDRDGLGRAGDYVVARVLYRYPSPVRAGLGAFRFPDAIVLEVEGVARVEKDGTPVGGAGAR